MQYHYLIYFVICAVFSYCLVKMRIRLQLSRAKHPSLRGHSKWSRRVAAKIPFFSYSEQTFYSADGAPEHIAQQRKAAMQRLEADFSHTFCRAKEFSDSLTDSISDVNFTNHYRVPFPFRDELSDVFKQGTLACETQGVKIQDIDGQWRYDLSGSYGVNVFGYDFYKACMQDGAEQAQALGPVLGAYHPVIAENVELLKGISGLDEVSFHMSGTEAVMQAVRLARYHTQKTHLVRFCGAYHGWWDGVQPGIGNNRKTDDVYTLADMSEHSLHVLATRKDIACVLINPLQAFHPNSDSASDVALVASDRQAHFDKTAYSHWLTQIKEICSRNQIVLIFDEVFTGFRLGYRGAQGFFGIQADLVTYGKTLGGGYPVGVLAGTHQLMKRFKDDKPVDVSFARGTFNSHPYVMISMHAFLKRIQQPSYQQIYQQAEDVWQTRVTAFNEHLIAANLPLKIVNMHSILSVIYTQPSRFNWMLQFYLKRAGLELSWTGTGRFIMSLNYTDEDFAQVMKCFIEGATQMQQDAWWWSHPKLTNQAIKRQFLGDMLRAKFPSLAKCFPAPLTHIALNPDMAATEVVASDNSTQQAG